jgi:NAD(P)-dependent dehydrogenase (short-subunit alcohol dehydrogenase family)
LTEKTALVTGGGSGIGRATALALAREGAHVVVSDIAIDGLNTTLAMIDHAGGDAIGVTGDVSIGSHVEEMVQATIDRFGRIDCAFNNAGIAGRAGTLTIDLTEDDWDQVIRVNLKGVWLCMKYQIPHMLEQGGGAIVNTSSIAGLVGLTGSSAYTASKHGVVGLTKTAALEFADRGLRINAVCPGVVQTPLVERIITDIPEREELYLSSMPVGRLGDPTEVAEAVVWLCSDAASLVTGHAFPVDGGYVAVTDTRCGC